MSNKNNVSVNNYTSQFHAPPFVFAFNDAESFVRTKKETDYFLFVQGWIPFGAPPFLNTWMYSRESQFSIASRFFLSKTL